MYYVTWPHRTLPTEHGIDTEIGAVYTVFGDKGNGLSSKFLDPWALCAHLDPMPRRKPRGDDPAEKYPRRYKVPTDPSESLTCDEDKNQDLGGP